jgi:phage head maturation protease
MAGLGHEKVGHTGQGLWHHKGWQLPAYIQHVANDLIASGHGESRAIEMAVGIVKNWAAGHDGHGNHVHADTQAKAAAAVAEWEAMKAAASKGSSRRAGMADPKKPYGDVEYADPGYQKDGKKRYPLTADKVMAAWSYINQADNASQYTAEQLKAIKGRIKAAMKKFGHDVSSDQSGGRSMTTPTPYTRAFALDDISIRAGGDGRTVDAYATVFDVPAHIRDQDGEYEEVNDRSMYNRAVADAAPAGGRQSWRVGVFYNHGMTIYQTPSDLYSMPVGVPLEIKPDARGLFTRTRYVAGQLGDTIIDGIREGLLTTYSVSGAYLRSDPAVPRGGFRKGRDGKMPTVRRMEATLREYGPTPFPAYPEAEVVGMRAEWAALMLSNLPPGERERLALMLRAGAPLDSPDVDASEDSELVAEDSRRHEAEMRSGRSPKEELELQSARFILRERERQAQRARSIVSQGENSV